MQILFKRTTCLLIGTTGFFSEIWRKDEEWRMRFVFICFFIFQCASCYFVFFIVLLRLVIIRNPLEFVPFHKKVTRLSCALIWVFVIVLNVLISSTSLLPVNEITTLALIYLRCHLGITIPVIGSIVVNIYLSLYLKKKDKTPEIRKFQNLINGLVIWMIICNVPYIAWIHHTFQPGKKITWDETEGV